MYEPIQVGSAKNSVYPFKDILVGTTSNLDKMSALSRNDIEINQTTGRAQTAMISQNNQLRRSMRNLEVFFPAAEVGIIVVIFAPASVSN
jgi:hypothetical protein